MMSPVELSPHNYNVATFSIIRNSVKDNSVPALNMTTPTISCIRFCFLSYWRNNPSSIFFFISFISGSEMSTCHLPSAPPFHVPPHSVTVSFMSPHASATNLTPPVSFFLISDFSLFFRLSSQRLRPPLPYLIPHSNAKCFLHHHPPPRLK
jgi:hypothetical protein